MIKYLEDFITHQLEDKALTQYSKVLAKQEIENINRVELWKNYACYLNAMYDVQENDLTNEEQSGVNEAFYQTLESLNPDIIVVLGYVNFDKLPEPTILTHFVIDEMKFDCPLNGEIYAFHNEKEEKIVKGYQING